MPQPTRPQLALYAAFAIAVLLIGSRFLRSSDDAGAGGAAAPPLPGAVGAPDGAGAEGLGGAGAGGAAGTGLAGAGSAGGLGAEAGVDGEGIGGAGGSLVVDVKGAVRRPGVYELPPGARALDAVRRAGGVTRRADRLRVNLAARVTDGGEVVVPRKGEAGGAAVAAGGIADGTSASTGGASGAAGGSAPDASLAIDINTASAQELEQLDGVGPATAAKIIAYREQHGGFASIDELDEVSGIGEAKLAAIRTQLGQ